jgi:hypothetical protein
MPGFLCFNMLRSLVVVVNFTDVILSRFEFDDTVNETFFFVLGHAYRITLPTSI